MKHWHQDTKCSVYHFVLILKATFCLYSKCTNHGKNKHLKTHEMVWQVFIPGGYAFSVETRHLVRAYQRVCLFSNSVTFMICVCGFGYCEYTFFPPPHVFRSSLNQTQRCATRRFWPSRLARVITAVRTNLWWTFIWRMSPSTTAPCVWSWYVIPHFSCFRISSTTQCIF